MIKPENVTNPEILEAKPNVISFPDRNIDTSWMTKTQKRYYDVIILPENKGKDYRALSELAGFKDSKSWYYAIKDERFSQLLTDIGVQVRKVRKFTHSPEQVEYITNPQEREACLKNDIWDMRCLFQDYPRHYPKSFFLIDFNRIKNSSIREIIKRYFCDMLGNWKPRTFLNQLNSIILFIDAMNQCFPYINDFSELDRKKHIERILVEMAGSKRQQKFSLTAIRQMFKYIYDNKWSQAPKTDALIITYDIPRQPKAMPRPILPMVKVQLDDYIENIVIPLLEQGASTPIIKPTYWDLLIIIRYTGRRFEDITHLISDGSIKDCLRYDLDGDPQLYVDHRLAKIPKDLIIPLAHLNNLTHYGNIVERAIIRQKSRVKDLPPAADGYQYLFRIIDPDSSIESKKKEFYNKFAEPCSYSRFNNTVLPHICTGIPLTNMDGTIYKITSHQFRHTVATEMIDAGVDPFAVKEFLGHSSIAMTERYIKVYQQRLKKELARKLLKTDAKGIRDGLTVENENYDSKWVKNKVIAVFELGDGCCEHPYKMPVCPHMVCKTCIKKKIYPRHAESVKATIESETLHRDNARKMGLLEKADEFNKVVRYFSVALDIISRGEVFDASRDFYQRGGPNG